MINRKQFIEKMDELMRRPDLPVEYQCGSDDHPLWEGEKSYSPRIKCKWFVCVKPIQYESKDEYWGWISNTLSGKMVCYCSNDIDKEEWWGFTRKADAVIWLLRWGHSV